MQASGGVKSVAGKKGFEATVPGSKGLLLACFTTDWCPYCVRFRKPFRSHRGRAGVGMVEVDLSDEDDPLWEEMRIDVVPTIVLFRDGKEVARVNGTLGKGLKSEDVDSLLAKS